MKTTVLRLGLPLIAALGMSIPAFSLAQVESYDIDPAHSAVIFRVSHLGYSHTYGRFRKISGRIKVDKKKAANSSVAIEIDADSVYTADKKRDKHLRSPDFLNTKQFPKIAFKSTKVRKSGKTYVITGQLTLHGVTKTVTVKMKHVGEGKDPWGNYRSGFDGSLTVKRTDYGMSKMVGPAGDKIELMISIEGMRKA